MAAGWRRARPSRIEKLAQAIDSLEARDGAVLAERRRVQQARRQAAEELHRLCSSFAARVNELLNRVEVALDPPEFTGEEYSEYEDTVFQIGVRGRIALLCFHPPEEMISTENFREPYVLEGTTRCFNQELLERADVEENLMFYCPAQGWQYLHPRNYQTGPLDEDYLVGLFEALL